jgi:hypothetical protein
MKHRYIQLGGTVRFQVAVNDVTEGNASDGSLPKCYIRKDGDAANAAPIQTPTPVLLSHASYRDGFYEVEIVASAVNGYVKDADYTVFFGITVSTKTPGGVIGSFTTTHLADLILSRALSNVEDTAAYKTLAGAIAGLVNNVYVDGSLLKICKTNDTDVLQSKNITTNSNQLPITGLNPS